MRKNINVAYLLIGFAIVLILVLALVKVQLDQRNAMLCTLIDQTHGDMSTCPAHKGYASWLLTGAFGLAFLVLGSGLYLVFGSRVGKNEQFTKVNVGKLSPDEKSIYEILSKNSGSAYQSDLIKETGMSKVKITRVLDRLETRKIVERRRRGMANIVILK